MSIKYVFILLVILLLTRNNAEPELTNSTRGTTDTSKAPNNGNNMFSFSMCSIYDNNVAMWQSYSFFVLDSIVIRSHAVIIHRQNYTLFTVLCSVKAHIPSIT